MLIVVAVVRSLGLLDWIWDATLNSRLIANTNTIFNLACALVLIPMVPVFEKLSRKIVKDEPVVENKYQDKLDALNPVFFATPALALNSCYDILMTQLQLAKENISRAYGLLTDYEEDVYDLINEDEGNIDMFADRISGYLVALLPHLKDSLHVAILNQYYKVFSEFERLGDHAVNIANNARSMSEKDTAFSSIAMSELNVLYSLLEKILDETEIAFGKRDLDAAYHIQPLRKVTADLIGELKDNHLSRMSRGQCNVFLDPNFENLLSDMSVPTSVNPSSSASALNWRTKSTTISGICGMKIPTTTVHISKPATSTLSSSQLSLQWKKKMLPLLSRDRSYRQLYGILMMPDTDV